MAHRRVVTAVRWLAPSAVAASAGAIAAGLYEGAQADVFALVATAGFLALVAWPALLAASVIVRALWHGWRARGLADAVIEDGGGAPIIAGWLAVIWLGALLMCWATFQGTWLLVNDAQNTSTPSEPLLKPMTTALAEPVFALAAAFVVIVASRPVALLFAWIVRAIDARWRKRRARSLVTPRKLLVGSLVVVAATAYVLWRLVVHPRIGAFDLRLAYAPTIGAATAALVHALDRRIARARIAIGAAIGAVAAAVVACALVAWQTDPSLTLTIWGDRPIAGLAIDRLFDLDAIRSGVSLSKFTPTARPNAAHPDIILVTIDTVRADHTPPYGGNADMPVLRELADRGTVFEWAFTPSNVTRRSIPSMLLGLAPNRVHGRVVGWALRIDPRHVMLAERLLAGGYDTAGFMCCEGFWGKELHTGLQRGLAHLEIEPNGSSLAKRARHWLDQREREPAHKPLFLWMHILEPHNWQAPGGDARPDEDHRKMYDHSLTASDAMVAELLGAFTERPPDRAPIVIVTADHGEALGDHGQPFHSTDLYDSQIRVPFVMAGPGIQHGRVIETVSLTDLTPTILDLAGFDPTHEGFDGRTVADLATGARASDPAAGWAFSMMVRDRSNPGGITAFVEGPWKLIDNGSSVELYDTRADPDERSNLVGSRAQIVEQIKRRLRNAIAAGKRLPF